MFERLQKMDRQTKIGLAVATVAGLLLFAAIAGVIRQSGWNEGFLFGLMAGRGDDVGHLAPYMGPRGFYGGHGWGGGFGLIGGFFRFVFFAFFLVLVLKMIGFLRWHRHQGWHAHGYGPHAGPWGQPPVAPPSQPAAPSGDSNPNAPPAEPQQSPQSGSTNL